MLIPKPSKPQLDVSLYCLISLLPQLPKFREKLLLRRIHSNKHLEEILVTSLGFESVTPPFHSVIVLCHKLMKHLIQMNTGL